MYRHLLYNKCKCKCVKTYCILEIFATQNRIINLTIDNYPHFEISAIIDNIITYTV